MVHQRIDFEKKKNFGIKLAMANQKDTNGGSDSKKSQMMEVSSDGIMKRKDTHLRDAAARVTRRTEEREMANMVL
jgi:hypothetical protein